MFLDSIDFKLAYKYSLNYNNNTIYICPYSNCFRFIHTRLKPNFDVSLRVSVMRNSLITSHMQY